MAGPLPHPKRRVPLLGDVLALSRDRPLRSAARLARELGPIYETRFFGRTIVWVSGPDLVDEILDENRFTKFVAPNIVALRPLIGDGLFTAYNDEPNLAVAHRVLRPAFTQSAMRGYHTIMLDVVDQLIQSWDRGTEVDVPADMTKVTLETIGRTGFGYSFDSFGRTRPHPFLSAMIRSLLHSQRMIFRPPGLGRLIDRRADRQFAVDVAYMHSVVDGVIRKRLTGAETGDDLLALMLNSPLDEVNIRYQIITFLGAGHETTANALAFALHFVANDARVLERAQSEVDAVWGDVERPAFELVAKLRYVRRIVDEAMRLWPTAPVFAREARANTVLGNGIHTLRAGDWVAVLTAALHRDPAVWGANADEFDPDRWATRRPKHAFLPFGTGARACIGRQLALHEAVLVLGTVLRRYNLKPRPDYRLDVRELLSLKPEGLTLTPVRR